jgi:hypothetical protein
MREDFRWLGVSDPDEDPGNRVPDIEYNPVFDFLFLPTCEYLHVPRVHWSLRLPGLRKYQLDHPCRSESLELIFF